MINEELDLAENFIENTCTNIFLTGRAGTGKTTFLQKLRKSTSKRLIVVAPTGVAAINAKGETIHSFFQLPFSPFVPGVHISQNRRFRSSKINIIRSLDLIVIDEISMVRSDTLDAIDSVMRRYKNREKPFGGAQLLMIGDLQQLPPVIQDYEWNMLRDHYESPYFFDSLALKQASYVSIELKHIYRQKDREFITLLERVRTASLDKASIELLNSRYRENFKPKKEQKYITLSSHNNTANRINQNKLTALKTKEYTFEANIKDNFPEHSYPVDKTLTLKLGAQVMFTKNDTGFERRFVNGTIGTITDISEDRIEVLPTDSIQSIIVEKAVWENTKYNLDEQTQEITEEIEGTFTQYPLRTAWAITIHKSQGLTFDYAMIDASDAFSHGQVYVALSRCRTLEGIVLLSKLGEGAVISDYKIKNYLKAIDDNPLTDSVLQIHTKHFFKEVLTEIYSFTTMNKYLLSLRKLVRESLAGSYPKLALQWSEAFPSIEQTIINVGEKFCGQIRYILNTEPTESLQLRERISKANDYFTPKINNLIVPLVKASKVKTDSKEVKKNLVRLIENLELELETKLRAMEIPAYEFSTNAYLKAKAKAILDQENSKGFKAEVSTKAAKLEIEQSDIENPELFELLREWRNNKAKNQGVSAFVIATQKALIGISNYLPQSKKEFLNIKGIGKVFLEKHAMEVLAIVDAFVSGRS